jgi:hypothetical protein
LTVTIDQALLFGAGLLRQALAVDEQAQECFDLITKVTTAVQEAKQGA